MSATDPVTVALQEALNATEVRGWMKNALMVDTRGRNPYMAWRSDGTPYLGLFRVMEEPEEVSCEEIVSCCTMGFIDYALACLAPLMGDTATQTAAFNLLEQVLWEREAVRDAAESWWRDGENTDGYYVDFADWLREHGRDEIGGEGLVPFWNDNIAASVEDVRALLREAIEVRAAAAV